MAKFVSRSIVVEVDFPKNPDLRKGSVHFTVEPPNWLPKLFAEGTVCILLDSVRVHMLPGEFSFVEEKEVQA